MIPVPTKRGKSSENPITAECANFFNMNIKHRDPGI